MQGMINMIKVKEPDRKSFKIIVNSDILKITGYFSKTIHRLLQLSSYRRDSLGSKRDE